MVCRNRRTRKWRRMIGVCWLGVRMDIVTVSSVRVVVAVVRV